MVIKLGLVLVAFTVFSGQVMPVAQFEYSGGGLLKGIVQENIMLKEQSDNALFLLRKSWRDEINKKYGKNNVTHIDDGVAYISQVRYINSRRTKVNIAEINRNLNPDIEIVPQLSSYKMHSKSRMRNLVAGENVLVAVNGTYFKQDTGTPLGTLVIDGEIISGPIFERAAFGITKDGYATARVSFKGKLKSGDKIVQIDNINQPRMMAANVLIYTSKWGSKSPVTSKPSTHIAIRNNVIIDKSSQPLEIPYDGYVISAPKDKLEDFYIGDDVIVDYTLSPNLENAENIISGGPYLLKDGKKYVDVTEERLTAITGRNPRTAIGYTQDNVMIMVTVDGRKEGSSGATLAELAQLMKELGCYEAINLDGGSSTVMLADGKVHSGTSIGGAVSISNALVVKRKNII
jgi:exopolysaccharide biosynthesis protein